VRTCDTGERFVFSEHLGYANQEIRFYTPVDAGGAQERRWADMVFPAVVAKPSRRRLRWSLELGRSHPRCWDEKLTWPSMRLRERFAPSSPDFVQLNSLTYTQ